VNSADNKNITRRSDLKQVRRLEPIRRLDPKGNKQGGGVSKTEGRYSWVGQRGQEWDRWGLGEEMNRVCKHTNPLFLR